MRLFVTGTSTEVGKTTVSRGLLRCWRRQGHPVRALKPVESGVENRIAHDARALADAAGHAVEDVSPWVRIVEPVSPFTAALSSGQPGPRATELANQVRSWSAAQEATHMLVEGAGGFCVPLNGRETFADFAEALAWPVLLVGVDRLGVQSDVLSIAELIFRRGLRLAAVVLNTHEDRGELRNAEVLRAHLQCAVVSYNPAALTDDALADAASPLAGAIEHIS